jgi:hydrogenase expression/formation protein HypE
MHEHSLGAEAAIVGTVTGNSRAMVMLRTAFGTTRIVDMLAGEQLPRIC